MSTDSTESTSNAAPARVSRPGHPPEDRFSRVETAKVGAHRQNPRPRYVWQWLLVSVLAFVLLTAGGIVWLTGFGGEEALPLGEQGTAQPGEEKVEGVLDPEASVAILNGTETPNLAAALDEIVTENEWGTILFSGTAASSDVAISAVFYANDADEAAAKGLAAELGGVSTYVSDQYTEYGATLVVLLGTDYAGPGIEEAAAMTAEEARDGAPADLGEGSDPEEEPAQ